MFFASIAVQPLFCIDIFHYYIEILLCLTISAHQSNGSVQTEKPVSACRQNLSL